MLIKLIRKINEIEERNRKIENSFLFSTSDQIGEQTKLWKTMRIIFLLTTNRKVKPSKSKDGLVDTVFKTGGMQKQSVRWKK